MYRRLIILSLIIVVALGGLSWLGYRAISIWTQGIEGTRITEFANVAEQVRLDVKEKLDAFMDQEQNRPYTDYQYWTFPEQPLLAKQETQARDRNGRRAANYFRGPIGLEPGNIINGLYQQQVAVIRSPLADSIEHGLAYFNFQIDPTNNIITSPNGFIGQQQTLNSVDEDNDLQELVVSNSKNIRDNLLPVLDNLEPEQKDESLKEENTIRDILKAKSVANEKTDISETKDAEVSGKNKFAQTTKSIDSKSTSRTGSYNIESFQNTEAGTQIQMQSRNNMIMNSAAQNEYANSSQQPDLLQQNERIRQSAQDMSSEQIQSKHQQQAGRGEFGGGQVPLPQNIASRENDSPTLTTDSRTNTDRIDSSARDDYDVNQPLASTPEAGQIYQQDNTDPNQADIIEVRIEPFIPKVVPGGNKDSIFGGQVFMVRQVTYEGKELIQGFQLNEKKLLEEVEESTRHLVRDGMSYELSRKQNEKAAYTAILDFGFGHLLLNLFENNPGRFAMQINHLQAWYFSIVSIVFLAVTLAVISLWLNAGAQIKLAQKKDDFVSAVSHELRTPLTSIRMHAEMLEKNWIKSESKLGEYYKSMRAESERLSRLIENVLDFSRIQKGRKKYVFKIGDINKCVADVVEMMTAYAAQKGFQIVTQFEGCREAVFDSDAVTQIVVNLLDNAIKYSGESEDKTIIVRTKSDDEFVLIEIEDHGPGIPHRQRKKVFQEFYRIGAEATREAVGSGLGLALVKKFAEAHNGFVEIINARPTGSIFRVSLAIKHL